MPLSYRMITKDESLADILDEHNQPITLIGEPEKLNRLLINNGYQPIDFTIEDNQRESRFVAFLDKHYNGKLKETLYIDYTESLSAEHMAKFVNEALEYNMPIEALVNDYIRENSDWCPEFEIIEAFIEATNQNKEDFFDGGPTDLYEYYRKLFDEYVELDHGAKDLLKNSAPEDLTIFFGDYWDDTCEDIEEHYNQNNKSIETPIEWLLKTQGYTEDDLHDDTKRQESAFLKTLYDELYDMSDLSNFQLVAIPDSNNWEAIVALCRKEGAIIRKSTTFGLFDSVHGGGSLMGITLEKDIYVTAQTPIHRVTLQEGKEWLDYTPSAVYDFNRDHFRGHDLDVQDDQPLLDDVLKTLEDRGIDTTKLKLIEEKDWFMKTFNITITEVLKTTVETKAETLEDAIQNVKDRYRNQEIILTADDFTGDVTFEEEQN